MLKYVGSAETVHFVNWVLHSGHVDPTALVRRATEEAEAKLSKQAWTPEEQEHYVEFLADTTVEKLTDILFTTLYEVSGELLPDYGGYEEWPGLFGEDYQGCSDPVAFLFAPMLARVLNGVQLGHAARHIILAHVNQLAEVAQTPTVQTANTGKDDPLWCLLERADLSTERMNPGALRNPPRYIKG